MEEILINTKEIRKPDAELLGNMIFQSISAFYSSAENQEKFERWLEERNKNKALI